jgi:hypothetical protein
LNVAWVIPLNETNEGFLVNIYSFLKPYGIEKIRRLRRNPSSAGMVDHSDSILPEETQQNRDQLEYPKQKWLTQWILEVSVTADVP